MRLLTIIGLGLACVGLAMGIVAWLVKPETIPYEIRFYLIIFAVVIFIAGIGLICGPFLPLKCFKEKMPFCYFSVYCIDGKPCMRNGEFQLLMIGVGVLESVNYWISPWGVKPSGLPGDPYYSIDRRKPLIQIIHNGGHAWDRFLPLGDYRIDFTAKQGNCYERLTIYEEDGKVKQRVVVTTRSEEHGTVLYSLTS